MPKSNPQIGLLLSIAEGATKHTERTMSNANIHPRTVTDYMAIQYKMISLGFHCEQVGGGPKDHFAGFAVWETKEDKEKRSSYHLTVFDPTERSYSN